MRITSRLIVLVLVLSAALVLPAVAQARTVIKARNNDRWSPSSVSVSDGTRVVWKNPTNRTHNVVDTSGNWNKNATLSANGGRTSYRFNNSGTYRYVCTLHSGMSGRIVVT